MLSASPRWLSIVRFLSGAVQHVLASSACDNTRFVVVGGVGSKSHAISREGIPGEVGKRVSSKRVELLLDRG